MKCDVRLPFGQTEIDTGTYRSLVDTKQAEQILADNGVANPGERLERFIRVCPEMFRWLEEHGRSFPWRYTTDPWTVYATEILLQRTRADAVEDLFEDFFDEFPTPFALYSAEEETIRELVYPLGFVNHRTRSLSEAAEMCVTEYEGSVPESLEALTRPWRAGDYSGRACLIFAFGQVQPLVDTNFARVIGRVLDYEMPTQPHKSTEVYDLLGALVPDNSSLARAFNLAILDIGALVCSPESPDCEVCPLSNGCAFALQESKK